MHVSITRHPCYGNTGSNRSKIIRSIKDNFDANLPLSALTLIINNSPVESCNNYTIAFAAEYPDHIDLFDQHSMTLCRRPRNIEILEIIRAVAQMGLGHRIFYSTKKFIGQVFTASKEDTMKAINSREAKQVLPNWHEFLSFIQNSPTPYVEDFEDTHWNGIMMSYNSGINLVDQISAECFINQLEDNETITTGHLTEDFSNYLFMRRRGRTAFICYIPAVKALEVFEIIKRRNPLKEIGSGLSPRFEMSHAQQLITLNNQHQIRTLSGDFLEIYAKRLRYCVER